MRGLVPFEVLAVLAVALAPLPEHIPVALPLVAVAAIALWIRGRSFAEVARGGDHRALIGAVAGLLALGVAVLAGTPVVETLTDRGVQWSTFPIVRGNASQALVVAIVVSAGAIASELALRGWIVERVLELSRAPAILAILIGGFAEAIVTPGDLAARIGAGVFGLGLGWMYVAGGRSIVAPLCARLVFQVGAVTLEALRLVG